MKRTITAVLVLAAFTIAIPSFAQEPAPSGLTAEQRALLDALNKLKISGYVQAQYVVDESSEDMLTGSGSRNRDQFSVRRGRLKVVYRANALAAVTMQIDASSGGVDLKDAFVELTEPWTSWKNTLTAGQFKWPFGFEVLQSSSDREMPERSRVIQALFPGERDRGAMLSGAGLGNRFNYRLAVVNGNGTAGSGDLNSDKDLVGRVGWDFGPLDLGASLYRGKAVVATPARPSGVEFDKERAGLDLQWTTPIRGNVLRAEYIEGKELGADVEGWYVYLKQTVGTMHQFTVRLDEYDLDRSLGGNAVRTLGGAYSLLLDRHVKIMLAYEHPERQIANVDDDVFTARIQYRF